MATTCVELLTQWAFTQKITPCSLTHTHAHQQTSKHTHSLIMKGCTVSRSVWLPVHLSIRWSPLALGCDLPLFMHPPPPPAPHLLWSDCAAAPPLGATAPARSWSSAGVFTPQPGAAYCCWYLKTHRPTHPPTHALVRLRAWFNPERIIQQTSWLNMLHVCP